jgi:hypothetical protein
MCSEKSFPVTLCPPQIPWLTYDLIRPFIVMAAINPRTHVTALGHSCLCYWNTIRRRAWFQAAAATCMRTALLWVTQRVFGNGDIAALILNLDNREGERLASRTCWFTAEKWPPFLIGVWDFTEERKVSLQKKEKYLACFGSRTKIPRTSSP